MASNRLWGNTNRKLVILDTSAIMMVFEFFIDIEKEIEKLIGKYDLLIPSAVINELELLSKNISQTKRKKAKMALKYLENKEYTIIKSREENADESVLTNAIEYKSYVITNDRPLIKKLKEEGIRVISLRSNKKLFIE